METLSLSSLPSRPESKGQRQKMLFGWMIVSSMGCKDAIVGDIVDRARLGLGQHPVVEILHPVFCWCVERTAAVENLIEIMGEASGANDQHALLTQGGKGAAKRDVITSTLFGQNRHLHDRNVGFRIKQAERNPDPVIEAAASNFLRGKAGSRKQ